MREAESRFFHAEAKIEADFRKDLAAALALGDRVDVFLLDFEMEDTPSDFLFWDTRLEDHEFPILPYGKKSKVLKQMTLTEEQRAELLPPLQKVVGLEKDNYGGAFCHFPIHGVRVFSGDKVIFHSSFCWACSNFAVNYPDEPAWVAIFGNELYEVISRLMPVPASELERFREKYPEAVRKKDDKDPAK